MDNMLRIRHDGRLAAAGPDEYGSWAGAEALADRVIQIAEIHHTPEVCSGGCLSTDRLRADLASAGVFLTEMDLDTAFQALATADDDASIKQTQESHEDCDMQPEIELIDDRNEGGNDE